MTERVTWICDGCDEQLVVKVNSTSDWKRYHATLNNAKGYPLCHTDDILQIDVHLCPSCAKRLASLMRPLSWPRPSDTSAEPIPTN